MKLTAAGAWRERLRLETAKREEAERRVAVVQAVLERLVQLCPPQAVSSLCVSLDDADEKKVIEELLQKRGGRADGPSSTNADERKESSIMERQPSCPSIKPQHQEQVKSEQHRADTSASTCDVSFTSDEWSACIKVLRIIDSHTRIFAGHIAQLAFAQRLIRKLTMKPEREEDMRLILTAMKPSRNKDRWLIQATELRKNHIKELERIKTILPQQDQLNAANVLWTATHKVKSTPSATYSLDPTGQFFEEELFVPRQCMICTAVYRRVHFFYGEKFCAACAQFNWAKRNATGDLRGRVALVTGGRIKIGYETALILLRCGATVYVTTRFPKDAAQRYSKEKDFELWQHRLHILTADFRSIRAVENLVHYLSTRLTRLDIIINNAAQTIARPHQYYEHLKETEETPTSLLPTTQQMLLESEWNDTAVRPIINATTNLEVKVESQDKNFCSMLQQQERELDRYFPIGVLSREGEQVDLRERNSWSFRLHQVSTWEFLEVQAINVIAPFIINARLRSLMKNSPPLENSLAGAAKFIVNVSAMEGQFYRYKTERHAHTNMAKAALNMMTRTAGLDYACDNIFMTAVDTGWVTDENPWPVRLFTDFCPPLDCKDGAARVVDPILTVLNGETKEPACGVFFKDYEVTFW